MTNRDLKSNEADRLQHLAHRLQDDPSFMAYQLVTYQQLEHLTDEALVDRLQTSKTMLSRIALCRCPDTNSDQFGLQVRQIATYTHSNAGQLAGILRHVATASKLKQIPEHPSLPYADTSSRTFSTGLLAAARDHDDVEGNPPDETDKDDQDSPRKE